MRSVGRKEFNFTCPRCGVGLNGESDSEGIAWQCATCNGIAIGVALLRQKFTKESISPFWHSALEREGTDGCDCPACGKSMTEVAAAPKSNIKVDVCRTCQFVWLDNKEIETFAAKPRVTRSVLPKEAQELIGMSRVQQIAETEDYRVLGVKLEMLFDLFF